MSLGTPGLPGGAAGRQASAGPGDARWARRVENVAALVAYGVGLDGRRQLLAVTIGAQESEASWVDLLRKLTARGLTSDHRGLARALKVRVPCASCHVVNDRSSPIWITQTA